MRCHEGVARVLAKRRSRATRRPHARYTHAGGSRASRGLMQWHGGAQPSHTSQSMRGVDAPRSENGI